MRKITFIMLLGLLALAPFASAQQTRSDGYYDRNGVWHPNVERSDADGYYDRNGQWHWYDTQQGQGGYYDSNGQWHASATPSGGYYDSNGQWHPYDTRTDTRSGGYYDRNGQWHPYDNRYGNSRVGRAVAPSRWTWSDNRGRTESLNAAARNLSLTAASLEREAIRRSRSQDRAAIDAVRRLNERAQYFARVAQQTNNRSNVVGAGYAELVDAFYYTQQRFAALEPDARLDNLFRVFSAAIGRLDKRYFASRVFGGQNPANMSYGYDRYDYSYDEYGNPLPRTGRDTRPYPH
jgi:hypothetical protein